MSTVSLIRVLAVAVAFGAISAAVWHPAARAQGASAISRTSIDRGVTVKVTPGKITRTEWEFAIVLDTHAGELEDDLQKTTVLFVGGRELQPLAWEGAGLGGHHREGVLRFRSTPQDPAGPSTTLVLRIHRPGEAEARVFRWE